MIDADVFKKISENAERAAGILGSVLATRYAMAQKDAALWKLRWEHANTTYYFFEALAASPAGKCYFTITGICTPSLTRSGKHHHTAKEWALIWQRVCVALYPRHRKAMKVLDAWKELMCA